MTKTKKPSILSRKALIGGIAGISLVAALALSPAGFAYASGSNDSSGMEVSDSAPEADETANPAREAAENSMNNPGLNMENSAREIGDAARKAADGQQNMDENMPPMVLADFISSMRKGNRVLSSQGTNANLELVYSNGWKEEIDHGRYVLVDPNDNKIINRPVTKADISRMRSASK